MSYRLALTQRALRDVETAALWWAENRSDEDAARWFDGIFLAIDSLETDPSRFGPAHENGRFPYELRERLFGLGRRPTHRILFTIRDDVVVVLSVRHTAQRSVTPDDLD